MAKKTQYSPIASFLYRKSNKASGHRFESIISRNLILSTFKASLIFFFLIQYGHYFPAEFLPLCRALPGQDFIHVRTSKPMLWSAERRFHVISLCIYSSQSHSPINNWNFEQIYTGEDLCLFLLWLTIKYEVFLVAPLQIF